jgi:hypothetical protein
MIKTCRFLFAGILILCVGSIKAQKGSQSDHYLFHFNPFNQIQPQNPQASRHVKVRLDFGLMALFIANDPHYTTGTAALGTPYTIGLKLDIPIQKNAEILVGADYMNEEFNFFSYYFAPHYSFLYNDSLFYNHDIQMSELQIPVLYKINFSQENRNIKTFYLTLGWAYRLLFYNNAYITNPNASRNTFLWEGQNDITSKFPLFGPRGSGLLEAALGYQHNALRNGNAWFLEVEYKLGLSSFIYSGNMQGSNNVEFTLNTLSFKFGLRL